MKMLAACTLVLAPLGGLAAADPGAAVSSGLSIDGSSFEGLSLPMLLRALGILTLLVAVPGVLLLATSYPRLLIVFSFLRRGFGTRDLPPDLVLRGLALVLTVALMAPLLRQLHAQAWVPFAVEESIDAREAWARTEVPIKRFLVAHAARSDPDALRFFYELSRLEISPSGAVAASTTVEVVPERAEELDFLVVLPAFVVGELKVAFRLGFVLLLPFLLVDLLVSGVLVSLGMFLVPPQSVALPLKVLVFILVDGWDLLVRQLVVGVESALV